MTIHVTAPAASLVVGDPRRARPVAIHATTMPPTTATIGCDDAEAAQERGGRTELVGEVPGHRVSGEDGVGEGVQRPGGSDQHQCDSATDDPTHLATLPRSHGRGSSRAPPGGQGDRSEQEEGVREVEGHHDGPAERDVVIDPPVQDEGGTDQGLDDEEHTGHDRCGPHDVTLREDAEGEHDQQQDPDAREERGESVAEFDERLDGGIRRDELVAALRPALAAPVPGPGRPDDQTAQDHPDGEHERRPCHHGEEARPNGGGFRHQRKGTRAPFDRSDAPTRDGTGPVTGTIHAMKKLILLLVVVAIGAVVYKVLTTEVPIDEA